MMVSADDLRTCGNSYAYNKMFVHLSKVVCNRRTNLGWLRTSIFL